MDKPDKSELLMEFLATQPSPRRHSRPSLLREIIRRIWHGGIGALLLILLCLLLTWLTVRQLSSLSNSTTRMEVMLQKERDGNRDNNVSYEIVGQITGWKTTTNKYDEMAIMLSRPVLEYTVRHNGYLDSIFTERVRKAGSYLTPKDSALLMRAVATDYPSRVKVEYGQATNGQKTSIVTLSLTGDASVSGGILRSLVDAYNAYTRSYNDQCYERTLKYLTHHADSIRREIDKLDMYDESFSESNQIVDISKQTESFLAIDKGDESDVRNMQLQRELLKIIRQYMEDMGQDYVVVPANTGIEDEQINRIVIQFNDLVMRRSNYMTSMGSDAMRVMTITNQIEDQRQAIIISIDKLTQAFEVRLKKYEDNKRYSERRLTAMPHKKIVKDQIQRERDIMLPLYTLLQQKRIETYIARSAEQDQARIVTPPYTVEESLVSSPRKIYLLGLLLGLLLALIYLFNIEIPVETVKVEDLLKNCPIPVWGVLPDVEDADYFNPALRALYARISQAGARNIVIASGYAHEGRTTLCEALSSMAAQDSGMSLSDAGSYHENPELPLASASADATLYCIRAEYSQLRSLYFIGYAVEEGILKNGAVVIMNAATNHEHKVNFGAFDFEVPTGFKSVRSSFAQTKK